MLTADLGRTGAGPGVRLLDVGAGGGRHAFDALRRGCTVVALDLDGAGLEWFMAVAAELDLPHSAAGIAVRSDALRLPFPDRAFDAVVASEVLEHVVDDQRAIDEIARVTRSGGHLVVSVPRWWPEHICWGLSAAYHEIPGGHVRIYRRRQLVRRLARAGFRLVHTRHAHAFHAPYWWLRCLVGVDRPEHAVVRAYRAVLEHDIEHPGGPLSRIERALDPLLGKSLVLYLRRD